MWQMRHLMGRSKYICLSPKIFLLFSRLLSRADPQLSRNILPSRNPAEYEKAKLESTYHADFPPPYPYEMKTVDHSEYADKVNESCAVIIFSHIFFYRVTPSIRINRGHIEK